MILAVVRTRTAVLLGAALATAAGADTVYLVNGNQLDDVVAERRGSELRIVLSYGEIVLAANLVDRVERRPSVWQEYRERELRLESASAPAGAWLELARWAERMSYEPGFLRALVRAAELEPRLEGLEPLMRRAGYLFDDEAGRWQSEKQYMERRGYLLWGDRWLPRAAYLERLRERREAERRRRDEARQERIARAIEALAVAELGRAARSEPEPAERASGPLVAVYTGGGLPFAAFPVIGPAPAPAPGPPAGRQASFEDLVDRQPSSPFRVRPRHLSRSD